MRPDVLAGCVTDFTTEYRLYRQVCSLQKKGLRVRVTGFRDPARPCRLSHWRGVEVAPVRVGRKNLPGPLFFMLFMLKMFLVALKARPRVLLACDLPVLFPFFLASRFLRARLVYDSREIFTELADVYRRPARKLFWQSLERLAVLGVDRSMTVCESDRTALAGKYPRLEPVVVRNLPLFRPVMDSKALRRRLDIPAGEPVILFQGSLLTSGGVVEIVESAPFLEKGRIVIIGDGPEKGRVMAAMDQVKHTERVHYLPPLPFSDLHEITCSADIGVYAGRADGQNLENALPNKVFEYALAGLPMILSDLPELRALNRAFDVGVLLEEVSGKAVADSINRLLPDGPAMQRHRENALRMGREMCWENEEGKFLALFEGL
jgi:glycosyltransferase involved in cell wall biosynthesis